MPTPISSAAAVAMVPGQGPLFRDEMLAIAAGLFVGNRLEFGEVVVDGHCCADLNRIGAPLVIFSSYGDSVTPPHQALGWLTAIFSTTEDLDAAGQRVEYLLHDQVGHLGIFVSAGVARREHRAILHHAATIQEVAPGLYEMILDDTITGDAAAGARFESRRLEDLPFDANPAGFDKVQALSEANERAYVRWVSPWVRMAATPESARLLRELHPMRTSRTVWSESVTPGLAWLPLAQQTLEQWGAHDPDRAANPWYQLERIGADACAQAWESWRTSRDLWAEVVFQKIYAS